jgi:hypothetical protein
MHSLLRTDVTQKKVLPAKICRKLIISFTVNKLARKNPQPAIKPHKDFFEISLYKFHMYLLGTVW